MKNSMPAFRWTLSWSTPVMYCKHLQPLSNRRAKSTSRGFRSMSSSVTWRCFVGSPLTNSKFLFIVRFVDVYRPKVATVHRRRQLRWDKFHGPSILYSEWRVGTYGCGIIHTCTLKEESVVIEEFDFSRIFNHCKFQQRFFNACWIFYLFTLLCFF